MFFSSLFSTLEEIKNTDNRQKLFIFASGNKKQIKKREMKMRKIYYAAVLLTGACLMTGCKKEQSKQDVSVRVGALNGKTYKGVITEKGVTANPLTRSYEVRALVSNSAHALLPGMVCDVWPDNGSDETAILLPPNVVSIDSNNREFVWIKSGNKATKRYIETGEQTAVGVIVTSGLSGGEEVIVEGQQKVSEGTQVIR